jgi:hypothetical protein
MHQHNFINIAMALQMAVVRWLVWYTVHIHGVLFLEGAGIPVDISFATLCAWAHNTMWVLYP